MIKRREPTLMGFSDLDNELSQKPPLSQDSLSKATTSSETQTISPDTNDFQQKTTTHTPENLKLASEGFLEFTRYLLLRNLIEAKGLQIHTDIPLSLVLMAFIDCPDFFYHFFNSNNPHVKEFKQALFAEGTGLIHIIENYEEDFRQYLEQQFEDISQIKPSADLAKALGVKQNIGEIRGELIARGIINDKFPGFQRLYKTEILRSLRQELSKFNKIGGKSEINPHFTLGKCVETQIGIALAIKHSRNLEHQIEFPSLTGSAFRVADFGVFEEGELSAIIEVKNGEALSSHDKLQLIDYLATGLPVTYIVRDKSGKLAQSLRAASQDIEILEIQEVLNETESLSNHPVSVALGNKKKFIRNMPPQEQAKLERNLFAVYIFLRENNLQPEEITEIMNATCFEDQQETCTNKYGIEWICREEYNRHQAENMISTSTRARKDPTEEQIRRKHIQLQKKLRRKRKKTLERIRANTPNNAPITEQPKI